MATTTSPLFRTQVKATAAAILDYLNAIDGEEYPISEFVAAYDEFAIPAILALLAGGKVGLESHPEGLDADALADSWEAADGTVYTHVWRG